MKVKLVSAFVVLFFAAHSASAQPHASKSTQELKEELIREKYQTEIALERAKRERLVREAQHTDHFDRQREIEYRRMEQEAKNRERQDDLLNINSGINIINNAIRSLEIIRSARF
jgi:hypothetical protein